MDRPQRGGHRPRGSGPPRQFNYQQDPSASAPPQHAGAPPYQVPPNQPRPFSHYATPYYQVPPNELYASTSSAVPNIPFYPIVASPALSQSSLQPHWDSPYDPGPYGVTPRLSINPNLVLQSFPARSTMPVEPGRSPTSPIYLRTPRQRHRPTHTSERRSPYVMWVGNVPTDVSEAELHATLTYAAFQTHSSSQSNCGIISIHMITRSNCALVNYESEAILNMAVEYFNGRSMRPFDIGCPQLVCRVRRQEESVKGAPKAKKGIHTAWVKEQRRAEGGLSRNESSQSQPGSSSESAYLSSSSTSNNPRGLPGSTSSNDERPDGSQSSNSSFLRQHFTDRYFILKSFTRSDLHLSVQRGFWATQPHNEALLDQAFRTSQRVYLIFGVNKSREFFGYARMIGPIIPQPQLPLSDKSPDVNPTTPMPDTDEAPTRPSTVPVYPISTMSDSLSEQPVQSTQSTYQPAPFNAANTARRPPARAVPGTAVSEPLSSLTLPYISATSRPPSAIPPLSLRGQDTTTVDLPDTDVQEEDVGNSGSDNDDPAQHEPGLQSWAQWGRQFKIEWVRVQRVQFQRARHLKNPWNNNLEVKVSRDGAEIEPTVGEALLKLWDDADAEEGGRR